MLLMAATAAVAAATKAEEEADAAEAGHLLLEDADFLLGGTSSVLLDGGSSSFLLDGGASSKRKAPPLFVALRFTAGPEAPSHRWPVLGCGAACGHGGGAAQRTGGQQAAPAPAPLRI